MQTQKIIFLTIILGLLVGGAIRAYSPDYVFFETGDKTTLGINWQPANADFIMQAPAKAIIEAIEIHIELSEEEMELPLAKAKSPVYKISVMSDQKIFTSPIEFLVPVDPSEGFSLWYWSNDNWEAYWSFVILNEVMYAKYLIDRPGEYQILLASDLDRNIELTENTDNTFSTSSFELKLPDVKIQGTHVVLQHLALGSVVTPDKLVSPIYQYELRGFNLAEISSKLVEVTLPYYLSSYKGRDLVFLDKRLGEWRKVPSINNLTGQTVTGQLPFTYAVVALVESTAIYDGIASWYAYKGCNCAAARFWPKQTKLKVTNLANGLSEIVRVNDYGPEEWTGRLIDLDSTVFKSISQLWRGLINVRVEEL